ncbi:MAG: bifunctional folylpolyglutamate synthase/dihydrofolate synthase [candidate division KSB1 bacterium]|nr:bifunctional folylpolyglutamate synthase/dihydrofolate synthase [candidate division KSB1 bacterium]
MERITALLERLGNPQGQFATVHIAGTNGKGSTAATLAAILTHAGIRTGLYTSPHLVRPEERIVVNGVPIAAEDFVELIATVRPWVNELNATFFEAMTALAFLHFARQDVEIAVVEVGLGGRLDATNVIHPLLTLITSIDIDHTQQLGATVEQIALEKAGIIKPGVPCLTSAASAEARAVLRSVAEERGAPFFTVEDLYQVADVTLTDRITRLSLLNEHFSVLHLETSLVGGHQVSNAALAVGAAHLLAQQEARITHEAVRAGLAKVHWPGRLQRISDLPTIVVDVAHNPAAVQCVVEALRLFHFRRLLLVMGVMRDKDYQAMVKAIAPVTHRAIAVAPATPRALPSEELAAAFRAHGVPSAVEDSPAAGLGRALSFAEPDDLILCTGSHYTVGEILGAWNNRAGQNRPVAQPPGAGHCGATEKSVG